jgi:hypothetical protein
MPENTLAQLSLIWGLIAASSLAITLDIAAKATRTPNLITPADGAKYRWGLIGFSVGSLATMITAVMANRVG